MDHILREADHEADVIILDSPPSLVADFQVLAAKVDGVFLVIQPGSTHANMALSTLERLSRVNAKILGVVLNKIPGGSQYHSYYPYKYDRDYYSQNEEPKLQVERQGVSARPSSRSQEVHSGSDVYRRPIKTNQRSHPSKQPKRYSFIPPEEVPPHNVNTKPKTYQDSIRIVPPNGAKKQIQSRTDFDA
jgi:Mrp family chromosome partitioning ATPase